MENELDRPAAAKDKVFLPYRYKETWDGWRTQLALSCAGPAPARMGRVSLESTGFMGRAHAQALPILYLVGDDQ